MTFSEAINDLARAVALQKPKPLVTPWAASKHSPLNDAALSLLTLVTNEWQQFIVLAKKLRQLEAHDKIMRRGTNNRTEWKLP